MKNKSVPAKSPWGCIVMALAPLVLLFAFITWRYTQLDEDAAISQAQRQDLHNRVSAVSAPLEKIGATWNLSPQGKLSITVPHDVAMAMTTRQAAELALTTHQKTGARVQVLSPAGQMLGQAP